VVQLFHICVAGIYVEYTVVLDEAPDVIGTVSGTSATVHECRDGCTQSQSCNRFTYDTANSMCYWFTNQMLTMVTNIRFNTYTKHTSYPEGGCNDY